MVKPRQLGPQTAVFIDWENVKAKDVVLDIDKFTDLMHSFGALRSLFIYVVDDATVDPFPPPRLSPFAKQLEHRGFVVREKVAEWRHDRYKDRLKKHGNMDVDITIDVMDVLFNNQDLEKMVLFSGDGEFCPLIKRIQRHREKRIHTTVISWDWKTSRSLARLSDTFIPYESLLPLITKGGSRTEVKVG